MTCQDCIHFDVCGYHITELTQMTVNECPNFKPKSRFVELPNDEMIMYVKDKWLMLNMESEHLGEAIKRSVDYLTKNARAREEK